MSVYIKGMEMPTSCLECRLYNDPWCMAKNINQWRTAYNRPPKGKRQNDCPLVPVPPHGRLVDADEITKDEHLHYAFNADSWYVDARDIELAPTIISAEEGE